ncbi:serpin B3-like [Phacochoerus africanus]|uniref:serpin B3-like n=1 Tax=Phacochoerus africanus TaxID=41426 RepID=UPI001FD9D2FC|nr:serpin B3-like [Phacochoerus africanus]XP_047622954.1 serpin B3-like [Phacochoerus africanus]
MSSLSESIIQFAVDLFQQIRRSEGGNIFYSPLSIMSALAMTYLGSRGHTASEIRKVLHLKELAENAEGATADLVGRAGTVHRQFQRLLTELNKPTDAYELSVANRLYGDKAVSFSQDYLENIKKFYLASVASVDFVNAAEESRQMINSWVESQTKGKIKDLFPKGTLSSSTTLVLVNAIYFKGRWLQEFKKENTLKEKFWLNKDTSKSVQMMRETRAFKFASLEHLHVKILEIPYTGQELSMLLLLPDEVDGLRKLEDGLTAEKLLEWTSSQNMKESQVDLHLPRFKVEESYDLKATLKALGMVSAFSADADFSGMTGRRGLAISSVVHKSFVEVTEEGTEAAAATGVVNGKTSAPFNNHFHCDHPFLFFIRHNKTNSILFCGRVSSP